MPPAQKFTTGRRPRWAHSITSSAGALDCPCIVDPLLIVHALNLPDLASDCPHMADCLDNVTGPGFTLGPYHRRTFIYPAQCLTKISCTTDKRDLKLFLINMVFFIGGCQ